MAKRSIILAAAVGVLGFVASAEASPITTGDVFRITFTDTSVLAFAYLDSDPSQNTTFANPDLGAVTSADFTLGALVTPGTFRISQVTNVVGTPPFLTVDFSALFFDANLFGLIGTITDTFLGGGGGLHSDVLTASDPPSLGLPGTWTLSDDHVTGGFTVITEGTYVAAPVPAAPVPEPSTLLLLFSGLATAVARRRTRKRKT